ncbi:MAG: hypothetical protein ABSA17_00840 [Rhabdochlamydiaceae bacterium]|jgi:hypothetical protein
MYGTTVINSSLSWACNAVKNQINENQRLSMVTAVAVSALAVVALAYQRLKQPSVVPFNQMSVSLGLSRQAALTAEEAQDLKKASESYSPKEFTRRLYAYLLQNQTNAPEAGNPQSPQEWLKWLCSNEPPVDKAHEILPSYKDTTPLTLEDEKAVAIQSWAMSLQPLFALIKDNAIPWKELLQPIQSSPRLAYTILFNCLAPLAFQSILEGVHDFLPSPLQKAGDLYVEHKGKIALAFVALIIVLYYRMNQERGIITNHTENYASSHKAHRGLDLVPSFRAGIDKLLRSIGTSAPWQPNSNILWYYNKYTHSTLVGEIGEILAEMTATGRVENLKLLNEFPQLKNLQVVEFDLRQFLIEYRDKDEVYRGWHETLNHLVKNKNTLVVFTGIDAIKPYFIPSSPNRNPQSHSSEFQDSSRSEIPPEKILSELLKQSLKQGQFRCLIELDNQDKTRLEADPAIYRRFFPLEAPDINAKELEELCQRLYTSPDLASSFSKEEIEKLFIHLSPILSSTPLSRYEIMDTIQEALRTKARSWRINVQDQGVIQKIEKAERALHEAQTIKDEVLQKLWQQRRLRQPESKPLLQALFALEHIVLPSYRQTVVDLKNPHLTSTSLVAEMQKRFVQMFGHCTKEEEERLKTLPSRLKEQIKGQDAAVEAICTAVREWRRVPPKDGKPLVMFFAGSSGIGKSETATKLAFELNSTYGIKDGAVTTNEANVKRINLNRDVQGGFIGWDKTKASILCHLLYEPTSVIILEEWDKMGEKEKSSLLELLDSTKCYLEEPWGYGSTNGPYVDKSCATFILTSNIDIGDSAEGSSEDVKTGIRKCYAEGKEKDAEAFLSRIDAVIPFQKVTETASENLVDVYLNHYEERKILPANKRQNVEETLKKTANGITDARALQSLVSKAINKAL